MPPKITKLLEAMKKIDFAKKRQGVTPLSWREHVRENIREARQGIGEYFLLSEDVKLLPLFPYPFKIDASIVIICTRGVLKGSMGLSEFEITASCLITLPAGEILKFEQISDDFKCLFIVLSRELDNDIFSNIKERMEMTFFTRANPVTRLGKEELDINISHYQLLAKAVSNAANPHLKKIVLHLLLALHYQQHPHIAAPSGTGHVSKQEETFVQFTQIMKANYKKERQVKYYANLLNLTPKYLSAIIKDHTGKTANEWIDEQVMLEAKALLKSSTLTVQQISDELNFTDQSSFGKYFKAHEGISPKEYRQC